MIDIQSSKLNHADLDLSPNRKDEADMESIVEQIGNYWNNPLGREPSDSENISTIQLFLHQLSKIY